MYLGLHDKEKIIALLKEALPALQVLYIFGSYGDGSATRHSDIDIAYLSHEDLSSVARWELSQSLAATLNKEIDLIDLSKTNTVFRYQIIANGERIYTDSDKIDAYESLVYSFYLRFQEERQSIVDAIYADKKILHVS